MTMNRGDRYTKSNNKKPRNLKDRRRGQKKVPRKLKDRRGGQEKVPITE